MAKSKNIHWSIICGLSDKFYYRVLGVKNIIDSVIFGEFLIDIKSIQYVCFKSRTQIGYCRWQNEHP